MLIFMQKTGLEFDIKFVESSKSPAKTKMKQQKDKRESQIESGLYVANIPCSDPKQGMPDLAFLDLFPSHGRDGDGYGWLRDGLLGAG